MRGGREIIFGNPVDESGDNGKINVGAGLTSETQLRAGGLWQRERINPIVGAVEVDVAVVGEDVFIGRLARVGDNEDRWDDEELRYSGGREGTGEIIPVGGGEDAKLGLAAFPLETDAVAAEDEAGRGEVKDVMNGLTIRSCPELVLRR